MIGKGWMLGIYVAMVLALLSPQTVLSQTTNALVDGEITDPQGAIVPAAKVTLISKDTMASSTFVSDRNGYYSFRDVVPGTYQLKVTAAGFTNFLQDDILVRVGYPVRIDAKLVVSGTTQEVEVKASATALNFENAEIREGIDPQVIQDVPLLVAGSIRSAANFAQILPGITHGAGDVGNAHVNGGQTSAGTVILDGAALWNSSGTQGLRGAVSDFPQSPDVISEFQVVTSNYDPQFGGGAGITVEHVRSGTDTYHGTVYEYNRNAAFNATQWGATSKAQNVENDFGGNFAGRFKLPFVGSKVRTFFFGNFEGFRIAGGVTRQTLSLPSMQERQGDFSDWKDSSGNLIPVYDPATRTQFMGCNGNQPNVICATDPRLQNSLAKQWLQFLPTPTYPGPLNNYLAPAIPVFLGTNAWTYLEKVDTYIGPKDHFSEMFYYKSLPETTATQLPVPISNTGTSYKKTPVVRVNYDHTFNEHIVNNFGFGYQNDGYWGGGIDGNSANKLPQIPGVASHAYPPQILFGTNNTSNGNFTSYGTGQGSPQAQPWLAPAYLVNDVVSMTKGKHTLSFGADLRFSRNQWTYLNSQSGNFTFQPTETGVLGLNSGNAIASFLLEQVDSASVTYYSTNQIDARQKSYAIFVGDTWRATRKLSISPGLRYEVDPPSLEAKNRFSYFDPTLTNPGAGDLPGALAFAGSGAGRSGARYPEKLWYGAFAPRLGFSYAVTPNTVVRSGYGLYYDDTNEPGYTGGIAQDGFNTNASFGSSQGGLQAAFILSQGVPQTFQKPPQINPSFDNGQNVSIYRPRNGNRLPYSQEWNVTIERQLTKNDYVTAAYVGSKGTRLLSQIDPLNALNPKYLASLGTKLRDDFQSGQTTLDGVNEPFPNFATIAQFCPGGASVAQALLAYPQYCNGLYGVDENRGSSSFNSFQLKAEHRFSTGLWALVTYTNSKLITDANNAENGGPGYTGGGQISPFQPQRLRTLAQEDIPQDLNIAYSYQLPFGSGRRWLNQGGIGNGVLGGWTFNGVFRIQSGIPFQITSSSCNAPPQLQAICIPALLPGANPFLQSPNHFDPNKPVLNVAAFESVASFNNNNNFGYTGSGRITQNFRNPGFNEFDIGLQKVFHVSERATFQLRGDAFNVLNGHHFNLVGVPGVGGSGGSVFTTDIANPSFGLWNGTVTSPRNLQVSGRISF